jgi:hypothetical protein
MNPGELGRTPEELTTIHENVADRRQIQERLTLLLRNIVDRRQIQDTVDAIVAKYNELMGGI